MQPDPCDNHYANYAVSFFFEALTHVAMPPGFGFSIGDAILRLQLAWKTIEKARKAVSEHHDLTHEVKCFCSILYSLYTELDNAKSVINRLGLECRQGLQSNLEGSQELLESLI